MGPFENANLAAASGRQSLLAQGYRPLFVNVCATIGAWIRAMLYVGMVSFESGTGGETLRVAAPDRGMACAENIRTCRVKAQSRPRRLHGQFFLLRDSSMFRHRNA